MSIGLGCVADLANVGGSAHLVRAGNTKCQLDVGKLASWQGRSLRL
jgi:hypothetical protein